MGVILDSSVLIDVERGAFQLDRLLEDHEAEPFWIAAITGSELLHGVQRTRSAAERMRRASFVEGVLEVFPVLAFDLVAARRHAELWAELARQGVAVGAHDLLIAATALARGEALATLDERDFSRVPGLRLAAVAKYRRS